jgi:dipeptidyl aminopeptidase/acylaminoacyl peptidase
MRLEDLFEFNVLGAVAISPDGAQIVFENKRFDAGENKNTSRLMIVGATGGAPRALTSGKVFDTLPQWSPDGKRIAFLSNRDKHITAVYLMSIEGGEPTRLTSLDGNVHDFSWSPDGRHVAYAYQPLNKREILERDDKKDELKKQPQFKVIKRLHHKLDGVGWWNGEYTHIWIIPTDGGKPKQLSSGNYDDSEPRFSPDGRLVSFVSNRVADPDMFYENGDIFVVRRTGGPARKLTDFSGECASHSWSPDGKLICFVGKRCKPREWWKFNSGMWLVSAQGGAPRELTGDIDNDCVNTTLGDVAIASFDAPAAIWSSDSKRIYFVVSDGGAVHVYSRSIDKRDTRVEFGGDVNVFAMQRTAPDGPIAVSVGTSTNPGDVCVLDPSAGSKSTQTRQVTRLNDWLNQRVEVGEPRLVPVRSGPAKLHMWVITPPGFQARRRYPAILEIHGGPHAQYGCAFFHEMQWLAAQGYVIVFSNPRGSTGRGLKFRNCIHGKWGSVDFDDVMKVADWMFRQPFIDKSRIGITGGSYGGYMTNFVVGHTDRFRAAVTQRSVVNYHSMFGTSDFGFELGDMFGGKPWDEPKELKRGAPYTYVQNIKTPLLIEHEEVDLRCPIEQAEQLFTALKVLGRTVEFVRFEGESHGLSRNGRPQNRAERLRRIADWFKRHMPAK